MNLLWTTIFAAVFSTATAESCLFDFENITELENFNRDCGGVFGEFSIIETPEKPTPNFDTGDFMLTTSIPRERACIRASKWIDMRKNQTIEIQYFKKIGSSSDFASLNIYVIGCAANEVWEVVSSEDRTPNGDGEWKQEKHVFKLTPDPQCMVQIRMSHSEDAVFGIDRITIRDPASTVNCYLVV